MEWKPTHRHRKGGEYMLVSDNAQMQSREWVFGPMQGGAGLTVDQERVAVYVGREGDYWVRPWAEFQERFRPLPRLEDLDAATIQRALLAGHLSPMDETTRQAYADAPEFCLSGEVGDFFVTVGWDPEDGDWRCEAYLGDAAALVDLKDGTWERL